MAWRAPPPGEPNLQEVRSGGVNTYYRESDQSERLFCCVLLSGPAPGFHQSQPETISRYDELPHGKDTQWSYYYTLPLCLHMVLCPLYAQKRSQGCEPAGDFPCCYHSCVNGCCCCVQLVPGRIDLDVERVQVLSSCRPWICCWKWRCCDAVAWLPEKKFDPSLAEVRAAQEAAVAAHEERKRDDLLQV